jgi:hypothetical protein
MKRIRIPGVIDLLISSDRSEIESLAQDPKLDRWYSDRSVPINSRILGQVLDALQIGGKRFPTVSAKDAPGRAEAQEALWTRLSAMAPAYSAGPDDLSDLAALVRGDVPADQVGLQVGLMVQRVVGRLFNPEFNATQESWNAAVVLDAAPRSVNPLHLAGLTSTKNDDDAKVLLAGMVAGDLAAVHAIGIAVHNLVSGVNLMQQLYADPSNRSALSPEAVSGRCVVAPATVLRQPTAPDSAGTEQFDIGTLVALKLQNANLQTRDADMAFMRKSWSRCPAEQWVPALLEGIWRRACQA